VVYVTSDLHGYPLDQFLALLQSADFSADDYLFVLGDVVDRGKQGVELLRWMAEQPNVQLIRGNHEAMLLACDYLFEPVTEESLAALDNRKMQLLELWLSNGASPTLDGLKKLMNDEPEILEGILDYLRDSPCYDTVEIGGRKYILVHAGLGNFSPEKQLSEYTLNEMVWVRPTLETEYFSDATVIFGHTPTMLFGLEHSGKAVKTKSWICIDTGAAMGKKPMLLRLDDLKEFY